MPLRNQAAWPFDVVVVILDVVVVVVIVVVIVFVVVCVFSMDFVGSLQ